MFVVLRFGSRHPVCDRGFIFAGRVPLIIAALLLLGMSHTIPAMAQETLYQRLGGQPGITRIVEEAYGLILRDDRVKDDFDNINPQRLKSRLVEHFCHITQGPCVYHGRPMAAAHNGLDLTRAKFNAVAEDVQTAMENVGIPFRTQNQLMALLAPMERDIVAR